MKKSLKNTYLFLVTTSIIGSSAIIGKPFKAVCAEGNVVNADSDYNGGSAQYDGAPSNMRKCRGTAGTNQIFQDDVNEISKPEYDTIYFNGGFYNRITDEFMNKIGFQDSDKRTKKSWSGFLGFGSGSCYISDFCCIYARFRDKYLANDVLMPQYGDEFGYSIIKTNGIEGNVSIDGKFGQGFGGFEKAGISFHFEASTGLESTYTTAVTYEMTNDFVSKQRFLCSGMLEHYIEYIVVKFSHKVTSGHPFDPAPTITLYMLPTVEIRRQLYDVETFCYEGGSIHLWKRKLFCCFS